MTQWAGPTLVVVAYLLGSISFGLVVAARHGVDLRAVGSGNVGATNVGRALGGKMMALVMLLDGLKGLIPALVARVWLGADSWWTAGVAVAAVVGHCVPVWHRFRGGKGAATAAGVMLGLVPWAGLAFAATYGLMRKVTKRSSVGSLLGAVVAVVVTGLLAWLQPPFAAAAAIAALVWVRHTDNLARLAKGTEPAS